MAWGGNSRPGLSGARDSGRGGDSCLLSHDGLAGKPVRLCSSKGERERWTMDGRPEQWRGVGDANRNSNRNGNSVSRRPPRESSRGGRSRSAGRPSGGGLRRRRPGQEKVVGRLLHEIFERRADDFPDAMAVECGPEACTYQELERRANRWARHLRGHGVGRGSCVGLLLPRSMDAYAAMLGILKAGAAYVPMDPSYPADRVGYILRDCGADALVTCRECAGKAAEFGGVVVLADDDRAAVEGGSAERLPARA